MDNLTIVEHQDLERHEAIIERGLQTFTEVGNALLAIRDERLYRKDYSTFEEYCRQKWGMSRIHAHRLIESATVAQNLLPMGNIAPPSNERQSRPLASLAPEQQREVWALAVETAPVDEEGQPRITAAHVQKVADAIAPRPATASQPVEMITSDDDNDDDEDGEACYNCKHALSVYRGEGDYFCCTYSMIVYAQGCDWCERWESETVSKGASQPVEVTIFSHKSEEYYTPPEYIEAAREVMGAIDLDPASCETAQEWVQATQFYTKEDNGLQQEWKGSIWLNPPYSKTNGKSNQAVWSQKLIGEYQSGRVCEAILLVKAALGYKWFEDFWCDWPVCFARERLSFIRANGSSDGQSKQGTAFFYFGDNTERFREVFSQFGRVIMPDD